MTIKGFYLIGQSKDVFHQDIHIDQYHDFEALQVAVAEQYNIIQAAGESPCYHDKRHANKSNQASDCKTPKGMIFRVLMQSWNVTRT